MMEPQTIAAWCAVATAVYAAGHVAVRKCVRPGIGFVVRVSSACDKVDQMRDLLGENGGKSLGDLIRSISKGLVISTERINAVYDQLDRPLFECDAEGLNVRINSAFSRDFGYAPADMLGHRWVRLIHHGDRERFMDEWHHALEDKRSFESLARYITRSGTVLHVRITAEPRFHEGTGELLRWLGRVEVVRAEVAA